MRLTILPHSLWLAYDIVRPDAIEALLPAPLTLAPVGTLLEEDGGGQGPKLLFNAFDLTSLWMRGHRVEVQTLATHRRDGTPHLVILDVYSNVRRWNPIEGLGPPNADCVLTSSPRRYALSVATTDGSDELSVEGGLAELPSTLCRRFAVDANRECYYAGHAVPFPLSFDDRQILRPVRRLAGGRVRNTLWAQTRAARPSHAFVHGQRMDYQVQVPGMWYDIF